MKSTLYKLLDLEVLIKPLNVKGIVMGVIFKKNESELIVRYFIDGDPHTKKFLENEIEYILED
jgi:hypothetical protein